MRDIKSAIITGATGTIGTALRRLLTKNAIEVCALVRPGSERAEHLKTLHGVSCVECDISQLSSLPSLIAVHHIDAFYHLAWAKTTGTGRNDMDAQIKNVQYTLDAVKAANQRSRNAGKYADSNVCNEVKMLPPPKRRRLPSQ